MSAFLQLPLYFFKTIFAPYKKKGINNKIIQKQNNIIDYQPEH